MKAPTLFTPNPGDVLVVDEAASVQFGQGRGFHFRVIRVDPRPTYVGWMWITGYQLDGAGNAVERRDIFVQQSGLKRAG